MRWIYGGGGIDRNKRRILVHFYVTQKYTYNRLRQGPCISGTPVPQIYKTSGELSATDLGAFVPEII